MDIRGGSIRGWWLERWRGARVPRGLVHLLALLCVLGQWALVAHHALVRHAPCVEHSGAHALHGVEPAEPAARAAQTSIAARHGDAIAPEHDTCDALGAPQAAGARSVVRWVVRLPTVAALAELHGSEQPAICALPLLALAPKGSPPALAPLA